MKLAISLLSLLALFNGSVANVSQPFLDPYDPGRLPYDMSYGELPVIDPVPMPVSDVPEQGMYEPGFGPNDLPSVDRPAPIPDQSGDLPPRFRRVFVPGPGVGRSADGVLGNNQEIPRVRLPGPFFRHQIGIDFGPNRDRIKVELKMYDVNGREVLRQDVVANGRVVIKGPVDRLAPGSYFLQLDCGDIPFFRQKLEKVD